ncbi:MAG: AtpZ/AtpI family protein [Microthrixaceae bacterium]|nr:AtpZ/AtpI family protein [Microthrixaceae bacterium]
MTDTGPVPELRRFRMTTDNPVSPALTDAAHRSAGSFELVLGPVVMALVGLLLDGAFGTRPLLTVLFTIWGALGAGASIYFRYRRQYATVTAGSASRCSGGEPRVSKR